MIRNPAFSLVELLIVVAIVAILCASAMPSYTSYIVKARIVELLTVADVYKLKVIENYLAATPQQNQTHQVDSKLIKTIQTHTLQTQPIKHVINIIAKMKDEVQHGIGIGTLEQEPLMIQLQGVETGDVISWTCHVAAVYNQYVPSSCLNNNLVDTA